MTLPQLPPPAVLDELVAAVAAALDGGPAVAVVPDGPPAHRRAVLAAVRPDLPAEPGDAFLVATSGSEGPPKVVRLGVGAVRASVAATTERLGGPAAWVLALPTTHVAGLLVVARSLCGDTPLVPVDRTDGFGADAFVRAADTALATGPAATALVPTQLLRLLDDPVATERLARLQAVLLGGAATGPALAARAAAAGVRVTRTYGMTETCGGCAYDGRPLRGVVVRAGPDGELLVRGAVLATGYRDRPLPLRDGWYPTSDLGSVENGTVQVLGRRGEVAVTGGVNVPLAQVDALLEAVPGVREAAAVAEPDAEWGERVLAAVVLEGVSPDDVRAAVKEATTPAFVPRMVVALDALPRLPSGKVDRAAVRRLLATGAE